MKEREKFRTYDYTSIIVKKEMESVYLDTYESFGWELTDSELDFQINEFNLSSRLSFRRNRRIENKTELVKLQKKSNDLLKKIIKLERDKSAIAFIRSISVGIIGLILLGISLFGYLESKLIITLLFGIAGTITCIFPYPIYKNTIERKTEELDPVIDQHYDELSEVCEEANSLITSQE